MIILIHLLTDRAYLGALVASMLLVLLTLPYTSAQTTNLSNPAIEQINQQIAIASAGIGDVADLDITEFEFLDPEEPSNLYLHLYNMEETQAHEAALRQVAAQSENDLFTVRAIIENNTTDRLDQVQDIPRVATEIGKLYNDALELQRVRYSLVTQNHFQQIYADGDEDNGEFDLIIELQTIHDLLFVGRPATYIDADPNQPSSPDFRATTTNTRPLGTSTAPQTTTDNDPVPSGEFCPIDPELTAALRDHRTLTEATEQAGAPTSSGSTPEPSDYVAQQIIDLIPDSPLPCEPGVAFCITIEEEYDYAQAYFPPDNSCVGCRIGLINNHLDELLGANLAPGKITGKFGELAECKDSVYQLLPTLNIRFEGKPIPQLADNVKEDLTTQKAADTLPERDIQPPTEEEIASLNLANQSLLELEQQRRNVLAPIAVKEIDTVFADQGAAQPLEGVSVSQAVNNRVQTFSNYVRQYRQKFEQMQATTQALSKKRNCSL